MSYYDQYNNDIHAALLNTITMDKHQATISNEQGMEQWCQFTKEMRASNHTMFFIGNGASATMSSHMSADASKNGQIKSLAFNDQALLTAVSNDIGYHKSFAMPLQRFATKGDILVTISSSGNSANIIEAIRVAREMGMIIVTLSGMVSTNKSRLLGDLNFFVPAKTYGLVECSHQILLHCWLDQFMEMEGLEINNEIYV
jgi:D-sedoheptulose 7-phosphate isomerase